MDKTMTFYQWLKVNYGIDWNTFDENYCTAYGQGKQYYEMYCEEMEEMGW